MEEQAVKTKAGMGLGIAGFVLGLVALIISFIPCLGTWALIPGVVGLILSAIALSMATKGNGAKGLIIAALIVSIIGTGIAAYQWYFWNKVATEATEGLKNFDDEWKNAMNDLNGELENLDTDLNEQLDAVVDSLTEDATEPTESNESTE